MSLGRPATISAAEADPAEFLWRARPDFLAYDIRDLPSRFAAAQRRRGLPHSKPGGHERRRDSA